MRRFWTILAVLSFATAAHAAVTFTTAHGAQGNSLNGSIRVGDLLSGKIGTELPGDDGWHSANGDPADKLPAFTDDAGIRASGLTGLLNDNNPASPISDNPVKLVQYDLAGATDLGHIGILTGNNGKDGRVYSTSVIRYSTNNGGSFQDLGYFQSDLSGTANPGTWGSTYVDIYDDSTGILASGVTNLQFILYSVSNTQGRMQDPFTGINPFTGGDDGFPTAFESPLVFELDATAVPEPATLGLLALAGLFMKRRFRA